MVPIIITLLDLDEFDQAECKNIFREEGFDAHLVNSSAELLTQNYVRQPFARVLIFKRYNVIQIENAVNCLKGDGADAPYIISCSRELSKKDEKFLRKELKVDKVIQPQSWDTKVIVLRILAALYGGVTVTENGDEKERLVEFENDEKLYLECQVPHRRKTTTRKFIGGAKIMREVFAKIKKYSLSRRSVLIRGETGSGKELVAAAIHSSNENNKSKKYVPINISEIDGNILSSELFGHVRGAFTDARTDRKGLLEEVGDGTIFLDEIGDLSLSDQAKLLRIFENREIRPAGAEHGKSVAFNARLIFATHKPLEEMCWNNAFREDLYQRIKSKTIYLPSLNKRKGDLELLAKEIFKLWNDDPENTEKNAFKLKQGDYDKIVDYCIRHDFRGNVRGLMGILHSCFDECANDKKFDIEYLRKELEIDEEQKKGKLVIQDDSSAKSFYISFDPHKETFKEFERRARIEYVNQLYESIGRNPELTRKIAKISKKTLYEYLFKGRFSK